jgi:hypothetical protein
MSKLLILSLALVAKNSSALSAGAPPRLWEVTGINAQGVSGQFYILPITHNGLAVEHDDYFYQKVLPIAMDADVLLSERATMFADSAPACQTPLADTRRNRRVLAEARAAVEKASYDFAGPAPVPDGASEQDRRDIDEAMHIMARMEAEKLSEYGLLLQMQTYLTSTQLQYPERIPRGGGGYGSRPEISRFLEHQRAIAKKANASIDENNDLYEMYCSMGEKRAKYLQQRINWYAPTHFVPPSEAQIARFSAGFAESMKSGRESALFAKFPSLSSEFDQQVVCDRNDKWVKRMMASLGTDVRFYAVGLMHVIESAPNHYRCDRLLVRLRKEGLTVRLVR